MGEHGELVGSEFAVGGEDEFAAVELAEGSEHDEVGVEGRNAGFSLL